MTEFARDAYSRTGHSLLDSIAIVHPFILTTLMEKVEGAVGCVGEVSGGSRGVYVGGGAVCGWRVCRGGECVEGAVCVGSECVNGAMESQSVCVWGGLKT